MKCARCGEEIHSAHICICTMMQLFDETEDYVKDTRIWYYCYECAKKLLKYIQEFSQNKDGKESDWELQYGEVARRRRYEELEKWRMEK